MDDLTNAIDTVTHDAKENTLYVIHVRTNEIVLARSEALLTKYRDMMKRLKEKSKNVIISGILPRINAKDIFYTKAFSTNNLKTQCEEGIGFVNHRNHFYGKPMLFYKDGLHRNAAGSARLGRLLYDAVSLHKSKNAEQGEATVQT